MSDAEHLIENAIMALEQYPFDEAERYFMEAPINIMMSKDSGCPLNAVWEMAIYCDTTLRQDWKEKWEKEAERWIPVTERLPEEWEEVLVFARCRPDAEGFVQTAVYIGNPGYWRITWNASMLEYNIVTHWKPLPEEPKEEHNG